MSAKAAVKKVKATPKNSEFGTCEKIMAVIAPMQTIERRRAYDRAIINTLFNGDPPYTKEEEEKHQIEINVNWGEGKRIMRDANNQLNTALLHPGNLFNVTLEKGQQDKRDEWAAAFTKAIHKPLQRGNSGKKFSYVIKNRNATIAMHGIGNLLWPNGFKWMPRFVPLEDLLIPTETSCDFSNLRYFAVNLYLTPGELIEMTKGDNVLPGWNQKLVNQVLSEIKDQPTGGNQATWADQPEEMMNIYKENSGWYYSDAVPRIRARYFFYLNTDTLKWHRMMLLREASDVGAGTSVDNKDAFLFDGSKKPVSDSLDQILSVQYGDANLVAPLKYHAVRGLGVDLYAPVETNNRLRCEFVQSVFEHLKMYFRIENPADRDRLKEVLLSQYGFIPQGLNFVKRDERHEIDPQLVDEAMGQMRQIMSESSSSYVQNTNGGTEKEISATEANILNNQANVMVSAMISSLYFQEAFLYQEIVRRFCQEGSADPQVEKFQKECISAGIPKELVYDASVWFVVCERVLGGSDKTQAQQEAVFIWQNINNLDPSVQNKARLLALGTLLNNFDKARELVPQAPVTSTTGTQIAEQLFGTLMTGNQGALRSGIDFQGYVQTLVKMMGGVVQRIQSTDNMGTIEEIAGLATVAQNIGEYLKVMAQNKENNQFVKQIGDALGQIMNEVKGFGQRLQEKHQSESVKENVSINYKDAPADIQRQMEMAAGFKPSQQPTPDVKTAKAVQGMKIAGEKHAQKMEQSSQSFAMEQSRQQAAAMAKIHNENMLQRSKLVNQHIATVADTIAKLHKAKNSSRQGD